MGHMTRDDIELIYSLNIGAQKYLERLLDIFFLGTFLKLEFKSELEFEFKFVLGRLFPLSKRVTTSGGYHHGNKRHYLRRGAGHEAPPAHPRNE